ncbi:MAG: sulfotransferase [Myxococcales bacterium]|nr:sulfotransferase [Myxococcales bacterium]
MRAAAATALGALGRAAETQIPALVDALADAEPAVRAAAADALGRLATAGADAGRMLDGSSARSPTRPPTCRPPRCVRSATSAATPALRCLPRCGRSRAAPPSCARPPSRSSPRSAPKPAPPCPPCAPSPRAAATASPSSPGRRSPRSKARPHEHRRPPPPRPHRPHRARPAGDHRHRRRDFMSTEDDRRALIDRLVESGEQQYLAGDPDAARATFTRALAADPSHPVAWNDLGTVHFAARDFADAERCFLRASLFDPADPAPVENLARLARRLGDPPLAAALLARLAAAAPDRAAAIAAEWQSPDLTTVDLVAVGCSPSSGSTLFADLLDSIPGVACGPESYLLCYPTLYAAGGRFPADTDHPLPTGACYLPQSNFFTPLLGEIGLAPEDRHALIAAHSTLDGFLADWRARYAALRDRPIRVFAEKTPINVNSLPGFCGHFGERGLFIHLVRDGRAVVASLVGRGYSIYEAAYVWTVQAHAGSAARRFDNAIELRYEDLLTEGHALVATLAGHLGLAVDAETIAAGHAANTYRGGLTRIGSWTVPDFAGRIEQTRGWSERLDPVTVAVLERLETVPSPRVGHLAGAVRFADLLAAYGYPPADPVPEDAIRARFAALEAPRLAPGPRRLAGDEPLFRLTDRP